MRRTRTLGKQSFEPFSPLEWVITTVLALICFGIPLYLVFQYEAVTRRQGTPSLIQEARR